MAMTDKTIKETRHYTITDRSVILHMETTLPKSVFDEEGIAMSVDHIARATKMELEYIAEHEADLLHD